MTPELFLLQRRRGVEKKISVLDSKMVDNLVCNLPVDARKEAKCVWLSRIGKTIEEIQNEQMEDYKRLMFPFLSKENQILVGNCIFGILPERVDFNAESEWNFSNGKYYVGLNDGLCHMISIFCHMYATASLIGDFGLLKKWMPSVARYLFSLQKKCPNSELLPKDIYPKDDCNYRYSEFLTCACIHYIMGHELGHIEHKDYDVGVKSISYDMEYKADRKGALLCYEIAQKDVFRRDQYVLAPLLTLCFLKIWEVENSKTHPPVNERFNRIVKLYADELALKVFGLESILVDAFKMKDYFCEVKKEIEYQKSRLEQIEKKYGTKLF